LMRSGLIRQLNQLNQLTPGEQRGQAIIEGF
jgi:hypothetical protein